MDLHVFPIPIPPPTCLSTRFLCSSILAWKIPWTEEPVRQATGKRVAKNQTPLSTHVHACTHTHVCMYIHTHIHSFKSLIRLRNGSFSPTNWGPNTNHICLTKKDNGRCSLQWGVRGGCMCGYGCVGVCLEKEKEEETGKEEGRWLAHITLRTYYLSVKYIRILDICHKHPFIHSLNKWFSKNSLYVRKF